MTVNMEDAGRLKVRVNLAAPQTLFCWATVDGNESLCCSSTVVGAVNDGLAYLSGSEMYEIGKHFRKVSRVDDTDTQIEAKVVLSSPVKFQVGGDTEQPQEFELEQFEAFARTKRQEVWKRISVKRERKVAQQIL